MANKVQSKAAIDAAGILIKNDIDSILPIGVEIIDGNISFGPIRWVLKLNVADQASAIILMDVIKANLTLVARAYKAQTKLNRRHGDAGDKIIVITTDQASYIIFNFV